MVELVASYRTTVATVHCNKHMLVITYIAIANTNIVDMDIVFV